MAIEGFDYQTFAQELAAQAVDLVPEDFQQFQRDYVANTIQNFATLCGEALYNDDALGFGPDQAMLVTQIIAEWSFHKSIDLIKAGILPDYWDGIMQKLAFTIFEVSKQGIVQGVSQDELLKIVEHHVKKTYSEVINELKSRDIIDDAVCDRALHQSNIDDMMQQIQEEKVEEEQEHGHESQNINYSDNSKILKLASVALLLRQMSQDKVQTILNKFDPQDAQTVIQYMQMNDLESKLDKNITIKCLQEIKTNLPEPKFISTEKILLKMSKIFGRTSSEVVDKITLSERPNVKDFITKSREGEYSGMPSKVANIIAQHLEESIS